jgi:hypothetical protein
LKDLESKNFQLHRVSAALATPQSSLKPEQFEKTAEIKVFPIAIDPIIQ